MKPRDIQNLQRGKTSQRVAAGESLIVTDADGTVIIAKAATPIKNTDIAFQKIDGTWVATDFNQSRITSKSETVNIRRTKKKFSDIIVTPEYKVKGLVAFDDGKLYKGGDGTIVAFDDVLFDANADELLGFASTGSQSLDYIAIWKSNDQIGIDKAGQRTVLPEWFSSRYLSMNGPSQFSDTSYYEGTVSKIFANDIITATLTPPSNLGPFLSSPTFTGEGTYSYYYGTALPVTGSQVEDWQHEFPIAYINFGDIFDGTVVRDYNLDISILNLSGTLSKAASTNWAVNITLPGFAPMINSYQWTENATGNCSGTSVSTISEITLEAHYKLPVFTGSEFIITTEDNIESQYTTTRDGVVWRSNSYRATVAFQEYEKKFGSVDGWKLTKETRVIKGTGGYDFDSLSRLEDIYWVGANNRSVLFTNTTNSSNITINTDSLIIMIPGGSEQLAGKEVGDTISCTFEYYLLQIGITDPVSVIIAEGWNGIPYCAGNWSKHENYDVSTETTITWTPNPGTETPFLPNLTNYSTGTFTYDVASRQSNAGFDAFWSNMENSIFDIYYKADGVCYLLEVSLSFEYIDRDDIVATRRCLTAITGTIISKAVCNAGLAKKSLPWNDYSAIAISQNNYWNYLQFAGNPERWDMVSNVVITPETYVLSDEQINGFLQDDQLILTYTNPPSLEDITRKHTAYTELFTLLPDGRFVRLGEESGPVSSMPLGTPINTGLWSYYGS